MEKKQIRPTWDEYFLNIAEVTKLRSTCIRRQVGCVVVGKDKAILTTGYNGAPKGCKHCEEIGCMRQQMNVPSGERHELCRASHAEMNAIAQAAANGVSLTDSTLYCTNSPCVICAKLIINAGIKKVVYSDSYNDPLAKQLLQEAGIKYKHFGTDVIKQEVKESNPCTGCIGEGFLPIDYPCSECYGYNMYKPMHMNKAEVEGEKYLVVVKKYHTSPQHVGYTSECTRCKTKIIDIEKTCPGCGAELLWPTNMGEI